MANGVQFRRVRGRVVPIRASAQQKRDVAAGHAMVATGVATALAAGMGGGALARKGARFAKSSAGFRKAARFAYKEALATPPSRPRLNRSAAQFVSIAAKRLATGKALVDAGTNVRRFGLAAGTALIAGGVHKMLPEKWKKDQTKDALITAGSGVVTAFAIQSGYHKQLGQMRLAKAARLVVKKAVRKAIFL